MKSNVTIQREVSSVRTLSSLLIVACVAIAVAQAHSEDSLVSFGDSKYQKAITRVHQAFVATTTRGQSEMTVWPPLN